MDSDASERPAGAARVNWPAIWTAFVSALAAWGLVKQWESTFYDGLPQFVVNMLYAGMATAAVTLLGGLYVLGLAWRGATGFARAFTVWQVFVIVEHLAFQVAFMTQTYVVNTLSSGLITIGHVAVGIAMILLARRDRALAAAQTRMPAAPPGPVPVGVYLVNGSLGFVGGAVVGGAAGLLFGSWIVDVTDVSCFEGGCGYAAVAIGLIIAFFSAVVGLVVAIRRTGRRA